MMLQVERGSTRSHCVENWLWKRLWACGKTDCLMDGWMDERISVEKNLYFGGVNLVTCTRFDSQESNIRLCIGKQL